MPSGVFTLKQVEQAIGQGAWTNQPPISVNYLVVAGGGAGAYQGAGGAGGLLQGTFGITAGTSYTVTVGSGGAGAAGGAKGSDGSNSVFGPISAFGGGAGGGTPAGTTSNGNSGGSGGGSADSGTPIGIGGQGTAGQGNKGGNAATTGASGGGGGAGTPGLNGVSSTICGNGGAGVASDISGTRTTYAGGGGGGPFSTNTAGVGGAGGGGNGGTSGTNSPGQPGGANTGGGAGGSAYNNAHVIGANGGSGVVIVSYPGTTQWFTGGVVNYYNGNVIHIFYQSGTLAPTTPTPILPTYQISRSLRFNSADSANLTRTPASAGNRKTWTWSGWIKITSLSTNNGYLFTTTAAAINNATYIYISGNTIRYWDNAGAGGTGILTTTAVYRDVSAWYHIVLAVDTTQATAANRAKLYVNGAEVTAFSLANYPNQNTDTYTNATVTHYIGAPTLYFDGYMTEINFIDGQQLTPSSFGETNAQTGVWQPKAYSGSYGTNGFYLNFSDNSNTTAATLGKDYSGNGNNWTPNNFSVTAGAGNDSLVDSPTAYGTADTGVGGEVRGNYCTWNPLSAKTTTISNGNLDGSTTNGMCAGTIAVSSGKWYWECTPTDSTTEQVFGIISATNPTLPSYPGGSSDSYGYYGASGRKYNNNSSASYGAAFGNGDVIGVALDLDAGTLVFYKNGSSQGTAYSGLSGSFFPAAGDTVTNAWTANFGQRPFAYTAPAGYRALTTWNLPTPPVGSTTDTQAGNYFAATTWTSVGGAETITNTVNGVSCAPDLLWMKNRTIAQNNYLVDANRGISKILVSNTTSAETTDATFVTALNSNGFSLGSGGFAASQSIVAWQWKANGAGSSNTAGSITSTVSANTTSGFSIATWTGTGSGTATIGHGLGVAPSMIILKFRNTTSNWSIYHASLGNTKRLTFTTAAEETDSTIWNNTSPTSTVFTTGTTLNQSFTYVAYCFAAVPGFSAFGSYTGNGSSDGPFVFTGMRPAFIMIKRTDSAGSWIMLDTVRNTFNVMDKTLWANLSDAEGTYTILDAVSNGFKLRDASNGYNNNGATYIYATFASNPFKYSLAR